MDSFVIGDLVVLTAGSMRMAVESVDGDSVACVWCHEGRIGRDSFNARLVKKWEHREEARPAPKPYGAPKPYAAREERPRDDRPRDDKPRGKPGWDGKPREKKFFRKES